MISAIVSLRGLNILQSVYCHNSNTTMALSAEPMCTETVLQKGLFSISKLAQFPHILLIKSTKYPILTTQTLYSKMAILAKLYRVVQVWIWYLDYSTKKKIIWNIKIFKWCSAKWCYFCFPSVSLLIVETSAMSLRIVFPWPGFISCNLHCLHYRSLCLSWYLWNPFVLNEGKQPCTWYNTWFRFLG